MAKTKKPDNRLKVTLTEKEREELEIWAKATGKSLSVTFKKAAFAKVKNWMALERISPQIERIIYEAGKQGVNLNQMARKLNAMEKAGNPSREIHESIRTARETAREFGEIQQRILEIL